MDKEKLEKRYQELTKELHALHEPLVKTLVRYGGESEQYASLLEQYKILHKEITKLEIDLTPHEEWEAEEYDSRTRYHPDDYEEGHSQAVEE